MVAVYGRNNALVANPPGGSAHLSTGGSDWLWAVFSIYFLAFLICVGLGFNALRQELIFHYIFSLALLVGSICYFAMAADLGFTVVIEEFHSASTYQVFYAKYIFWVVAFPLITVALNLVSGVSWATVLYNVFLTWIWIITYLCAAFISTSYKWGFFTFGTIAYLLLAAHTLGVGRVSASGLGSSSHYTLLSGWVTGLWFLYVIAFAVSDGANIIGVNGMFIFFGILDLLLIPVVAIGFVYLAPRWNYDELNLNFTRYGRVRSSQGRFPEKNAVHGPTSGNRSAPIATEQHGPVTQPQASHVGPANTASGGVY